MILNYNKIIKTGNKIQMHEITLDIKRKLLAIEKFIRQLFLVSDQFLSDNLVFSICVKFFFNWKLRQIS